MAGKMVVITENDTSEAFDETLNEEENEIKRVWGTFCLFRMRKGPPVEKKADRNRNYWRSDLIVLETTGQNGVKNAPSLAEVSFRTIDVTRTDEFRFDVIFSGRLTFNCLFSLNPLSGLCPKNNFGLPQD